MKKENTTIKVVSKVLCGSLLFASPAIFAAEEPSAPGKQDQKERTPYTAKNNSWISLEGKVTSAGPDSFNLDYGKGSIIVEMDDHDWYPEGYQILEGDNVRVYGSVDADPFEIRSIEAGSVWVKGLNTYFSANSDDEEDFISYMTYNIVYPTTGFTGKITKVKDNQFMLKTADRTLKVDVDGLADNPLDKKGYQQLKKGDKVWVSGTFDENYFENNEIQADSIVTLKKKSAE